MARQKIELIPGKKYKGVGYINEYGQMQFDPYQQGTRNNALKVVKEGANYSLYESVNILQVRVSIQKSHDMGKLEKVMALMKAFQGACVELRKYL